MPPTPLAIPSTTAITATQYYLNGSTILTQITGDDRFDFFYDENGLLLGFSYNGAKYYYIRNQQSDIIGILDNSGNQVVSYMYDSWGKLLSIDGSAKDTIGVQNPFRYRGYYYDTETELYYLNSRYYDPMVGRYINADGFVSTNQGISEHNMFAYCGNNPIMRADPSGCFWEIVVAIGATIAILAGSVAAGIYNASYNRSRQYTTYERTTTHVPFPITTTIGNKTTHTVTTSANSSNTVTFQATRREDNIFASSVGVSVKAWNYTFTISLGGDNIGFSSTYQEGDTQNTSAIRINPIALKAGVEFSTSTVSQWDNETVTETTYSNTSLDGWTLITYACLAYGANISPNASFVQNPAPAY